MNETKLQVTESLVREIVTTYNHYKGHYKMDSLFFKTPDDIIKQITKDLNEKNQLHGRDK